MAGSAVTVAANSTIQIANRGITTNKTKMIGGNMNNSQLFKPFKLSRPIGLIGTTAHWWAIRYCYFTGKDDRTYCVKATLIGNGYYDLPPDGRGLIVEVLDDQGENLNLKCMEQIEQPLTYDDSDKLLVKIESELGIQPDSAEVQELEKRFKLS